MREKVFNSMALVLEAWSHQVGWYLRNCMLSPEADHLFRAVETHTEKLATRVSDHDDEEHDDGTYAARDDEDDHEAERKKPTIELRKQEMASFLSHFAAPPPIDAAMEENVHYAAEEFGLAAEDIQILLLVVRSYNNPSLDDLGDDVLDVVGSVQAAFASLTGLPQEVVDARLAPDAPLVDNGLLVLDRTEDGLTGPKGEVRIAPALLRSMKRAFDSREEWTASLLGRALVPEMDWDDYSHLGGEASLAARALSGWRSEASQGMNVMLVGSPGIGKTEFAKCLAARAGMRIWAVGEADDKGNEPSRSERLSSLRLAFAVLRSRQDTALLLDEAEDVLQAGFTFGSTRSLHSKNFVNRTIETNPVPVIWTCNSVSEMDPATVRRMTLLIEMKVPDRKARRKIWSRVLDREGLVLPEGASARLGDRWRAPPAVAASAAHAARLAGGGEAEIETALVGSMRALGIASALPERDGRDFDPELSVCREDLEELAAALSRDSAARNWSMCISGEPGTGKSEFARHLATRLGLRFMQCRASDMLDKYIGESEKRIAAVFAEARTTSSLLIVDEVDAMLFSRVGATKSWEVSQVNEMLTWMEDHPLPFIATTNSASSLDKASLRRFTFKLEFLNLGQDRAAAAFRRILKAEPPARLPENLSPGDFANVRRKAEVLACTDPATLARWLSEEAAAKGGAVRTMGFGTGCLEQERIPSWR